MQEVTANKINKQHNVITHSYTCNTQLDCLDSKLTDWDTLIQTYA
jgi:hypothetical protein